VTGTPTTRFRSRRLEAVRRSDDPRRMTESWRGETPFGVLGVSTAEDPLRVTAVGTGFPAVELLVGAGRFPHPGSVVLDGMFSFPMTLSIEEAGPGTALSGPVDLPYRRGLGWLLLTRRSRTVRARVGAAEWRLRARGRGSAELSRDGQVVVTSDLGFTRHRIAATATPTDLAVGAALSPLSTTLTVVQGLG